MSWKSFSEEYLSFSRNDRIAVLIIAFMVICFAISPAFFYRDFSKKSVTDSSWLALSKNFEVTQNPGIETGDDRVSDDPATHQYDSRLEHIQRDQRRELFDFDPNTLEASGWRKLGIREKTATIIRNYLSKGGYFNKPEDLKKIYGLSPAEYERIAPFIQIEKHSAAEMKMAETYKTPLKDSFSYRSPKRFENYFVDINLGDTSAFIALPGIGSRLASRIVNFREKLGGFYSSDQVGEVYGLPDSTFQKIKKQLRLSDASLRKININTATLDELKNHPYIRWSLANSILAYRKEHGPFLRTEELKKIMAITDDLFTRLSPYLTL